MAEAELIGDDGAMAAALDARHVCLLGPEHVEERIAIAGRLIDLAAADGDAHQELIGHGFRLVDLLEAGELAAADDEIARHAELATQLRRPRDLWLAAVLRATRAHIDGRFADCELAATEGVLLGTRLGMPDADAIYAVQVFAIRWQQGRLAELRPILEDLVRSSATIVSWRCALALVDAELGDAEAARSRLDELGTDGLASMPGDWLRLPSLTTAAQATQVAGARDHAPVLYDLLLPYAARQVVVGAGFGCLGSASRYLGLLALAMGDEARADAHLADAIAADVRMGALPWAAQARCDRAIALGRRGDLAAARALAADAAATGHRLGMARLVAQAEAVLGQSGDRPAVRV
jgi:hypothetical protein